MLNKNLPIEALALCPTSFIFRYTKNKGTFFNSKNNIYIR